MAFASTPRDDSATEWTSHQARRFVSAPRASDDKYSHGVLGVVTGSELYPGAAVLGVEAAHRTGIGMVRYLGPGVVSQLVLARRPETVTAVGKVQAWLLGSGMDASRRTHSEWVSLQTALQDNVPTVIDAGALDLCERAQGPVIIVPHARELARLLLSRADDAREGLAQSGLAQSGLAQSGLAHSGLAQSEFKRGDEVSESEITELALSICDDPGHWAKHAADVLRVTVVLKGHETHVCTPASPNRSHIIVPVATSWLATAGTGDVLAGIVSALCARFRPERQIESESLTNSQAVTNPPVTHPELAALAATAVLIHAEAAALASQGGPIVAMDVAETVPFVIRKWLTA